MKISNIDIYKVENDDLRAIVQFTIDDSIRITGVKLHTDPNGNYILRYPVNPASKKKLAYIFPLSNEVRLNIENQVIDIYEAET